MYRQGDLLLVPVANAPQGTVRERSVSIVLLEGEATGHAHRVVTTTKPAVTILAPDGSMFLSLAEPAMVIHEEHHTISLPAGDYRVMRQQEYAPEAIRNVRD